MERTINYLNSDYGVYELYKLANKYSVEFSRKIEIFNTHCNKEQFTLQTTFCGVEDFIMNKDTNTVFGTGIIKLSNDIDMLVSLSKDSNDMINVKFRFMNNTNILLLKEFNFNDKYLIIEDKKNKVFK